MGESSGAPSAEAGTNPLLARQGRPGEGVTDDGQPVRASSFHSATSAQGGTVTGIPLVPGAAWPPGAFSHGVPARLWGPYRHKPVPPVGSRMTVTVDPEGHLEFRIPVPELGANWHTAGAALAFLAAGIWITIFFQKATHVAERVPLPFLALLLPLLAVGLYALSVALRAIALMEAVRIRGHEVELEQRLWGWVSLRRLPRASLTHVDLKPPLELGRPVTMCCLAQGTHGYEFGFNLSPPERRWLLSQLSLCLRIPLR